MTFVHIPDNLYCSKAAAAKYAGVTLVAVQKWIERGHLRSIKIGGAHLIAKTDLDARLAKVTTAKAAAAPDSRSSY